MLIASRLLRRFSNISETQLKTKNELVLNTCIATYDVTRVNHRQTFIFKRLFRQQVESLQFYNITTRRPETRKIDIKKTYCEPL